VQRIQAQRNPLRRSKAIQPILRKELFMKSFSAALLASLALLVGGCNTIEGAGKDVQATGQAIENTADKAKPK
jgi:predicted small secreted protein